MSTDIGAFSLTFMFNCLSLAQNIIPPGNGSLQFHNRTGMSMYCNTVPQSQEPMDVKIIPLLNSILNDTCT